MDITWKRKDWHRLFNGTTRENSNEDMIIMMMRTMKAPSERTWELGGRVVRGEEGGVWEGGAEVVLCMIVMRQVMVIGMQAHGYAVQLL